MLYKHLALLIRDRVASNGSKTALRFKNQVSRSWVDISYNEMGKAIDNIAKSLIDDDVKPKNTIGIFSRNMPEWSISDFAIMSVGAVTIPIYPTDSAAQTAYIIRETEMKIIFVGEQEQYDKVLQVISDDTLPVKMVVFDDSVDLRNNSYATYFRQYFQLGEALRSDRLNNRLANVSVDDIATILYTSGTTGEPKGVILSHSNFTNTLYNHDVLLDGLKGNEVSLSFLPLSHIFERAWSIYCLHKGIQVNCLLNPKDVIDGLKEVKPHIMCAVPRFFEKTYHVVMEKVESSSPLKKKLFHWAVAVGAKVMDLKRQELPVPMIDSVRHAIADKLVLKSGRAAFGGNIIFFPCGGAMLPNHINQFFHSVGVNIKYAYGLTEACASVTVFRDTGFKFGTVGKPLPNVEVKIGENNEILLRCKSLFQGYYKKPEETAKSFENGWFKTGDAGEIDEDGCLIMKERIKDLIKTSSGKFIAPQQIESMIGNDPYVEHVMAIGDNRKFLSALIVPNFSLLEKYAREMNIRFSTRDDLLKNSQIVKFFEERVHAIQEVLANYQRVKKFALLNSEFSIPGGEFTSTLKTRRGFVLQKYSEIIERMYRE